KGQRCRVGQIDVAEHDAKAVGDRRRRRTRNKKVDIEDIGSQGGKKPLCTERIEKVWIARIDIAKLDGPNTGVSAHLKTRAWSREHHATRRVDVEKVGRQVIGRGERV